MKITTSVGFVAVIALTLLAARVEAQIDSNAKVRLYCSLTCDRCSMTIVHTTTFTPVPDTVDRYSNDQYYCVFLDTFVRYSGGSSQFNSNSLEAGFTVDTAARCFRNFGVRREYVYGPQGPCANDYGSGGGEMSLQAVVDSLPYEDSSGVLSAFGTYYTSLSFSAAYSCRASHQFWEGHCGDNTKSRDTILIKIFPNAYLLVSEAEPQPDQRTLKILQQGTQSQLCSFHFLEIQPSIEVFDLLGRSVQTIPPPGGVRSLEISTAALSPGCYFARLGDQVAKFVVPPR